MNLGTKIKIAKMAVKVGIMFGPFSTLKTIHKVYEIGKMLRK